MDDDGGMRTTSVGMEVLNRDESLRLLARVPFGRIVFTLHALPAVQPVNFLIDRDRVVIRTSSESKLAVATAGAIVAFEADDIDTGTRAGWSVTVVGPAVVIDDPDDIAHLKSRGLESWATPGSERFIGIQIEYVTGRWLHSPVVTSTG